MAAEAGGIASVGVVGCGLMGSGIAQVAATAGFSVTVREVDNPTLEKGLQAIRGRLDRAVEKGSLSATDRAGALARLHGTTRLKDLAACDIVIEAIAEEIQEKCNLFRALDPMLTPPAILASNTSSLTVTEMAAATSRPDRVLGMHFFNPVPALKLVEVVATIATSADTVERALAFVRALGKDPIVVRDTTGFVVNYLLVPYLLDAIRAFEHGLASMEDIDKGMRLGCSFPMGPFSLLDFVGLDTMYRIANVFFEEYREARYAPPPLLRRLVLMGHYGRKTGRGFYDYSGDPPRPMSLRPR